LKSADTAPRFPADYCAVHLRGCDLVRLPKGCFNITDAFNAAGREKFGESWLGGQRHELAEKHAKYQRDSARHSASSGFRPGGWPPPNPEDDVGIERIIAGFEAVAIVEALQAEFVGTPPKFQDARSTYILCDLTLQLHLMRPEAWIDKELAKLMLTTGRVAFSANANSLQLSPTGHDISGMVLVCDTSSAETIDDIDASSKRLRHATDSRIDAAIRTVYDKAEHEKHKPPNIKEIVKPTQEILKETGYYASGVQIQRIAGNHADRRRRPGKTIASERKIPS
jgi:hypothetical protein